jgi:hypothetical protein
VGMLVAAPLVAAGEVLSFGDLRNAAEQNVAFERVVERVRAEPGDVISEPYDVAVLAGRPVQMESVIFSILLQDGRWNPRPMIERICSGSIRMLVLDRPIADAQAFSFFDVSWWPPPIIASLRDVMRLDGMEAGRYIYVPRADLATAGCH